MWPNPNRTRRETADLVTFTEKILNAKLYLLCSGEYCYFLSEAKLLNFCISKTLTVSIYLFKVNNRNTRRRNEIFPKLTIKTPEQRLKC